MNILEEAAELVDGSRQDDYGHPAENFELIGNMWSALLKDKLNPKFGISSRDVALMMALLKIARQVNKAKRDNLVDAVGYLRTYEKIEEYDGQAEPGRVFRLPPDVDPLDVRKDDKTKSYYYINASGDRIDLE